VTDDKDSNEDAVAVDTIAYAMFRAWWKQLYAAHEPQPEPPIDIVDHAGLFASQIASDAWRAAARVAYFSARSSQLGARPAGSERAKLSRLMDETNFLGSGLTVAEWMRLGMAERMAASWSMQDGEEKQRRLDAIVRLSVELAHIRETTSFATRMAEVAIEYIIEGRWDSVEKHAEMLTFNRERAELRERYVPIYANFRELILQAVRIGKTGAA